MSYTINPNAKNRWARNAENTMDLSLETDASSVYLDNGRTLEQEIGEGSMVSNVTTVDSGMEKVIDDTYDLSLETDASSVYLDNGRTLEQEIGEGSMVSNVTTVDSGMEKVIDDTYDGAYESCKMYGKSLVNLFNSKQVTPSLHFSNNNDGKFTNVVKSNGLIEFDIVGNERPQHYFYIEMGRFDVDRLKPNTKYLIWFEDLLNVTKISIRDNNATNPVMEYFFIDGKNYVIGTTLSEWTKSNQILYLTVKGETNIHVKVKNPMIIEYQEGMEHWLLDYFEGLQEVKSPILKNVGKNLFDIAKVETNYHTKLHWTTSVVDNGIKSVRKQDNTAGQFGAYFSLKVKPSTTYTISRESYINNVRDGIALYVYHNSGIWGYGIKSSKNDVITFTTLPNTDHITLGLNYGVYPIGTVLETRNLQLEEMPSSTVYEPYKTNILETSNDVVLRGLPNGVKDSYNCLTGEYVRRVGEVVLNGSENWANQNGENLVKDNTLIFSPNGVKDSYNCLTGEYVRRVGEVVLNGSENWANQNGENLVKDNTLIFSHGIAEMKDLTQQENDSDRELLCDKQKVMSSDSLWNTDNEGISKGIKTRDIRLRILKSKLSTEDINGLKLYLQANPITIQYELAEPIVTTIGPSTTPFAYENGHIILESGYEGQSLLPTLEYSTVINKTGLVENVAKTIQRQEKQLTMLEKIILESGYEGQSLLPTLEYSTVINKTGLVENVAKTIQRQEKQLTMLEKMLIQNIINLDYNNTLLTLKNEMEEML